MEYSRKEANSKNQTCLPAGLSAGAEPVRCGGTEAGNLKFEGKNMNNSKMCHYTSCLLNK